MEEVGTYTRDLRASRARAIENALDWEHLPHVHDGSFASIAVEAHDATGWSARAALADGTPVRLDLRLTHAGWITTSRTDGRALAEIHTVATATRPDSCRVAVSFRVADVPADRRARVGAGYVRLYERLYDEDEAMMIARADALRRGPATLRLRRTVTLADGSEHAVPVYCPHQALPLDAEPDADGIVTCPWHGYRFDVRTGACVSGQAACWTPAA